METPIRKFEGFEEIYFFKNINMPYVLLIKNAYIPKKDSALYQKNNLNYYHNVILL